METAALMNDFLCLVVRGICHYSDSHKNNPRNIRLVHYLPAQPSTLLLSGIIRHASQGSPVDLLRHIREWEDDPRSESIFWLNGMAGTGNPLSLVSFAVTGRLGASFFFIRGEGDRGRASKFFTTIAAQLVSQVPLVMRYIQDAEKIMNE
ncbi:hypothetical protein jhhlp_003141 [Lomentospora prolificans]|uniref:Nephrocystin 3-like N-terminal domain-containing protein n=1 Tax=Lomentospora prolificans TaxID=41688 RepID=A0A2N3NG07_9PEZI|nr:hypothetical protein jhhlp_003141 [Lomentospora prolificans]